ncbi:MAG: SRPBCC family protein [Nocardioides sp.]
MRLRRTVTTDAPPEKVFAYLADFTTTTEWDPGTVHTERVSGDGGVGTTYRNVSRFAGRRTELTYTVVDVEPQRRIALRGENGTVKALDTMTFRPAGAGTEVTYTADFDLGRLTPVLGVLLWPVFRRLGDQAEKGMRKALARL